jgi:hypothetical protein
MRISSLRMELDESSFGYDYSNLSKICSTVLDFVDELKNFFICSELSKFLGIIYSL